MARKRSLVPVLPLPRRALPWVLFALGLVSIGFGALSADIAAIMIGAIALGGALLSWAAEWLLAPAAGGDAPEEDGE